MNGKIEPLYFGEPYFRHGWSIRLSKLNYTVNRDRSIDVIGDVDWFCANIRKRLPFNFKNIKGNFSCSGNFITSLKGCPVFVEGYFDCSGNRRLTSFEGAPLHVTDHFDCSDNPKITSLDGLSNTIVGKSFYCNRTPIASLKGAPSEIKGAFEHEKFTDKQYRDYKLIKDIETEFPEMEGIFH